MSQGHAAASDYPLGRLSDEAALAQERENGRIITEAQLLQTAVSSILSKSSRSQFQKMIKSLNVTVKAHAGLFGEEDEQSPGPQVGQNNAGLWD